MISGYEWWLIQDYWLGSNGIMDTFQRPKPGVVPFIKEFNAPSILIQDGLALTFASKDVLNVSISLSNFGNGDLPAGTMLRWAVLADGVQLAGADVATKSVVAQGTLGIVASIVVMLPDAGSTVAEGASPVAITLTAELVFPGRGFVPAVPGNSWNATLFPRWVDSPTHSFNLSVTDPAMLQGCLFNNCGLAPGANAKCEIRPGMGYPTETAGADLPCLDSADCCSMCKLDTGCRAAVFESTAVSAAGGVCHIYNKAPAGPAVPTPNSTVATWSGGGQRWPRAVYLTASLDDAVLEAVRDGSVVVLLQVHPPPLPAPPLPPGLSRPFSRARPRCTSQHGKCALG